MKNIFFSLISIAAFAVVFSACKKQDNVTPDTNRSSMALRTINSSEECNDCCSNAVIEGSIYNDQGITGFPFFTIYENWNPVEDTLCEDGPQIQWEGQFNSFVKGINGWNVSVLDSVVFPPATDLNTIDCADNIQNYILSGVTSNAVGSKSGNRVGYYSYANQVYNIENFIVAWKCCTDTEDPNYGKVKFYVIKVTNIIPIGGGVGPFDAQVEYEYICRWCTVACPS